MPKIDKRIFYRCTTPNQAAQFVSRYAKDYGGTVVQVCMVLRRIHGLDVTPELVRRTRQSIPTWATDSRPCAAESVTHANSQDFLVALIGARL